MFWIVTILFLFLSLGISVLAGNHGLWLPAVPLCAFSFAMRGGALRTGFLALPAAALLDALWMRHFPGQCLATIALLVLAHVMRKWGDTDSWCTMTAAVVMGTLIERVAEGIFILTGQGGRWDFLGQGGWELLFFSIGYLLALSWLQDRLLARRLFSAQEEEDARGE